MTYKIWYAAPNHLGYCTDIGFVQYPHACLQLTNAVVKPGDVYLYGSASLIYPVGRIFIHKRADEYPPNAPCLIVNDGGKGAFIEPTWSKHFDPFVRVVRHSIQTHGCERYLHNIVNSQPPLLHQRVPILPQRATWAYAVNAGRTFNYKNPLKIHSVLCGIDSDRLKGRIVADLIEPRIKTFVFVVSGIELNRHDLGNLWMDVGSSLGTFGYTPKVIIWDAVAFSYVLSHFPKIANEIIRKWYAE